MLAGLISFPVIFVLGFPSSVCVLVLIFICACWGIWMSRMAFMLVNYHLSSFGVGEASNSPSHVRLVGSN